MYHVGLTLSRTKKDGGRTAFYQMRKDKDCLSCELFDYLGVSNRTKKQAREDLKKREQEFIQALNVQFPRQNITKVMID